MKKVMFFVMLLLGSVSIFAANEPGENNLINVRNNHCTVCGNNLLISKKEEMKMEVMKIYTCTTHSEISSSKPGKCAKCNKKLMAKKMNAVNN
jgi:uncharacterized protein with PIN domain